MRLTDTGEKLGGARKDKAQPSSQGPRGQEQNPYQLRLIWPRPQFREAVLSGSAPPQRAAEFLALHDNLSRRPPRIVVPQVSRDELDDLWKSGLLFLRAAWENPEGPANLQELENEYRAFMEAILPFPAKGYALYINGPATRTRIDSPFSLKPEPAARRDFLVALGWPGDARLSEKDAFCLVQLASGSGWAPAEARGTRWRLLGDPQSSKSAALSSLRNEVEQILSKRAASRAAKNNQIDPSNRPAPGTAVRTGPPNPRRPADADPNDLVNILGFRGVEFGNYVPQGERQQLINQAFDACFDLARLLRFRARGSSLDGALGIAFGSRGRGGKAEGHFEPGSYIIHQTRHPGTGVLAHEFGHALDAYLAERAGFDRGKLLSEIFHRPGCADEYTARFQRLIRAVNKDGRNFVTTAIEADRGRKAYWSKSSELFARLFETWVYDLLTARGERNDFLVFGVNEDHGSWSSSAHPYPSGPERETLVNHMHEFLRWAIPAALPALSASPAKD